MNEIQQKLKDTLEEKRRKICEELDAEEREARFAMTLNAERWGRRLTNRKLDDPADAGAARSPPDGSTRNG